MVTIPLKQSRTASTAIYQNDLYRQLDNAVEEIQVSEEAWVEMVISGILDKNLEKLNRTYDLITANEELDEATKLLVIANIKAVNEDLNLDLELNDDTMVAQEGILDAIGNVIKAIFEAISKLFEFVINLIKKFIEWIGSLFGGKGSGSSSSGDSSKGDIIKIEKAEATLSNKIIPDDVVKEFNERLKNIFQDDKIRNNAAELFSLQQMLEINNKHKGKFNLEVMQERIEFVNKTIGKINKDFSKAIKNMAGYVDSIIDTDLTGLKKGDKKRSLETFNFMLEFYNEMLPKKNIYKEDIADYFKLKIDKKEDYDFKSSDDNSVFETIKIKFSKIKDDGRDYVFNLEIKEANLIKKIVNYKVSEIFDKDQIEKFGFDENNEVKFYEFIFKTEPLLNNDITLTEVELNNELEQQIEDLRIKTNIKVKDLELILNIFEKTTKIFENKVIKNVEQLESTTNSLIKSLVKNNKEFKEYIINKIKNLTKDLDEHSKFRKFILKNSKNFTTILKAYLAMHVYIVENAKTFLRSMKAGNTMSKAFLNEYKKLYNDTINKLKK